MAAALENSKRIFLRQGHPLAEHAEITKEELLSYPQVRFTQDGNNFRIFMKTLSRSLIKKQ